MLEGYSGIDRLYFYLMVTFLICAIVVAITTCTTLPILWRRFLKRFDEKYYKNKDWGDAYYIHQINTLGLSRPAVYMSTVSGWVPFGNKNLFNGEDLSKQVSKWELILCRIFAIGFWCVILGSVCLVLCFLLALFTTGKMTNHTVLQAGFSELFSWLRATVLKTD